MFVHSYTVLNDEENINASECQEPLEHGVVLLQEALGVHGVRAAVPVRVPVLVHVPLAVVVAVVVASVGLVGETAVTHWGSQDTEMALGQKEQQKPPPFFAFSSH